MTLQERIDAAVAGGDYTLACMLATELESPIDHLNQMVRIWNHVFPRQYTAPASTFAPSNELAEMDSPPTVKE